MNTTELMTTYENKYNKLITKGINKYLNAKEECELAEITKLLICENVVTALQNYLDQNENDHEDDVQEFYERTTNTVEQYWGHMTVEQAKEMRAYYTKMVGDYIKTLEKL